MCKPPSSTNFIVSMCGLLAIVAFAAFVPPAGADADVFVIRAARVYTMSGEPIESATIVVRDGRIVAVGSDVPIPENARVLEFENAVVTPGLIDACCVVNAETPQQAARYTYGDAPPNFWQAVGKIAEHHEDDPDEERFAPALPGEPLCPAPAPADAVEALAPAQGARVSWAGHASEVTPHCRVFDAVNLFSNDFQRLARSGVTTVYISPDSASVIGARGAIVKTAGPLDHRVVRAADAVKASLGSDPSYRGRRNILPPYYGPPPNVLTRRPTTRMGVDWVFRKAFYDAKRTRDNLEIYGADQPPAEAIPVLLDVLDGRVPLRIQARMQHDIFSALRLADEFDLDFILEEALEAYRCLPQLAAADVPVIFGPLFMEPTGYRAYNGEADRPRLNAASQMHAAGIRFALTARELRDEQGLVRQGAVAVRNGLAEDVALRALTRTPAELMGLSDVGFIAPDARADLVVWSRSPFDAASRPLLIMVDGRIVHKQN